MGEGKNQTAGGKVRIQQRARRLGICHHSGSILPAPLRLLQDLAKVGGASSTSSTTLQRRNAIIRKNSAPARSRTEIAGPNNYGRLVDVTEQQQHQRCSLTAVSQGLSIISTSAVVVLYVSDRRPSLSSRHFRSQNKQSADCSPLDIAPTRQRVSYPVASRGVRRSFSSFIHRGQRRRRRWTLCPSTSWILPTGVYESEGHYRRNR